MAGIFTKHIRQPCICQSNELQLEIKKKTGWCQTGSQTKIWEAMAHPGLPLESPLAHTALNIANFRPALMRKLRNIR